MNGTDRSIADSSWKSSCSITLLPAIACSFLLKLSFQLSKLDNLPTAKRSSVTPSPATDELQRDRPSRQFLEIRELQDLFPNRRCYKYQSAGLPISTSHPSYPAVGSVAHSLVTQFLPLDGRETNIQLFNTTVARVIEHIVY